METIIRRIFVACFIAIVLPNNIYAQSDQEEKIILKEDSDIIINDNEEVRRDMLLYDVLPEVVLYTSNGTIGINSPHVTFESVIYYIMDANGIIVATDEIDLPKNVEVILPLLQLSRGSYRIILGIDGVYYVGEFQK